MLLFRKNKQQNCLHPCEDAVHVQHGAVHREPALRPTSCECSVTGDETIHRRLLVRQALMAVTARMHIVVTVSFLFHTALPCPNRILNHLRVTRVWF